MNNKFKRTMAKVMAAALVTTMAGAMVPDASAAKAIKLADKSVTIIKGDSKKVSIKNVKAKKIKKLTVRSKNKKVATVKKSGKTAINVTGKEAGSTKVTVMITLNSRKKATTLTLKVKVKKGENPNVTADPITNTTSAPTATANTTIAPTTTATPSLAATAIPAEKGTKTLTLSTPAATVTPTPDTSLTGPCWGYDSKYWLPLTEANAPVWAISGNYGTPTFNADGTVSMNTNFSDEVVNYNKGTEKKGLLGEAYNNGIAFYIDKHTKDQKDISVYKYLHIIIATNAEFKLLTWAGGSDSESFWDKKETWGAPFSVVDNGDGTKTYTYAVADVFTKVAKAKAIGLSLKAVKDDTEGMTDDNANQYYQTATAELKGIVLTEELVIPVAKTSTSPAPIASATPSPTPIPVLDDHSLALTEANTPAWVTSGRFGNTTFISDGTVLFNTNFSDKVVADNVGTNYEGMLGSIYNNGVAFYINKANEGSRADISAYKYLKIVVSTDAKLKLMTWGGSDSDAESFWDKRETWEATTTVDNGDGTKTLTYSIDKAFTDNGLREAKAIGFSLIALKEHTDEMSDDDTDEYLTATAELKSIVLTQK